MSESSSAGNKQPLEEVSFREYRSSDRPRCVDITAGAWPQLIRGGLDQATFEWYEESATWREIAYISDAAVGLLFGKIDSDLTTRGWLRMSLTHMRVYLKLLFGLYGKVSHRLTFLRNAMSDDMNVRANSPDVDGEIAFFVVDAIYRGRGIGKQLMNRFIDHAKRKGAKRISVVTTDIGSNWEFYERYGFRRYSSFRDRFYSFARREEVATIIYVLDTSQREYSSLTS